MLYEFLMNFLCIYLGEKKGGGCTNACICMGTHNQPLLQNRFMDVMKLGKDEVLMVPYKCFCFRPDPSRGRSKAGQK